jgi:hypothetical protein
MDERRQYQQEDERYYPAPLTPRQGAHPMAVLWSLIGGALLFVFLVAGIIAAHEQFVFGATLVIYILVALAVVVLPGSAIYGLIWLIKSHQKADTIKDLEIRRAEALVTDTEAQARQREAEAEYKRAQVEVLRRTIPFDGLGNAALIDPYTGQVLQLRGNFQQYPNLHTYHNAPRVERISEDAPPEQGQLSGPALPLPKIEQFYEQIPYNSLQTGMGAEKLTGKLVIVDIRKSVHFKLVGGSEQGKSCVAAAILDIATTTNDPDHLKIGLLDLEYNTSRLFENLPHIAEIGPKRIRLIGRDPDEVAQRLKLLLWELHRRERLGEAYCAEHEPVILVYVEEALALKYEVVDKKLNQEMLAAINVLGVRARKYGIFLLVVMQVDYSDKSTREAMAQFRTRAGFAIDPEAARASGFFDTKLVKQNYQTGRKGQYVLERPSYSGLVLAPDYDVRAKLIQLSAPSQPATARPLIPFNDVQREAAFQPPVVDAEVGSVVAPASPLQGASRADLSRFTPQEQRIITKFMRDGMNISQLVASEYTNSKGEPLTGGESFKQRSKEVQDVLRRYFNQEAS